MEINNFYKGKKVLITGNTGFKGSWMSKILLDLGAEVVGYALKPNTDPSLHDILKLNEVMKTYYYDICDYNLLNQVITKEKPEIIFHLAAQPLVRESYKNPVYTFNTNIMGSVNLLDVVRNSDFVKSLVMITTDKVYENKEWVWGYRENDRLGGKDPYSSSKSCVELITQSYIKSYFSDSLCKVASARGGNVIGGGDWSEDRIIPDIIRSIYVANKELEIRSPDAIRPWQHVMELLYGYLILAKGLYGRNKNYQGAWNFGPNSNNFKNVKSLVETGFKILDKGSYKIINPDEKLVETNILKLNIDKVKQELNWNPTYDFTKTLELTFEWYKKYYNGDNIIQCTEEQILEFFKGK